MAVSDKKKASNAKWDRENMSTLGCRIRKGDADAFRALCKANEVTPHAVLLSVVSRAIISGELPITPSGGVTAAPGGYLTPAALKLATEAAQKPGKTPETVSEFIERAIESRDEIDNRQIRRMGRDPVEDWRKAKAASEKSGGPG